MTELWYKNAVFYEVFVRAFVDSNDDGVGDLAGLTSKLDYLKWLGVDAIWMLPICPSPLRDDGYDVSDFCDVHPDYGSIEDLITLVREAHRRELRVLVELIPNHTSDQIYWFQASRDPSHPEHARYRDWYVWSDTDERYQDVRIIFLDTEPSNWTYDAVRGQYFWHRFFRHQPDLNYDNPAVQKAMLKVVQFWTDMGVDGFRVDATPYLYEREGTSCENLPETHTYLKRLRQFVDAYAPGTMLLSEANMWPEDVRPYLGDGDEFHMNFHFPLMPRIFMALACQDRTPIIEIMERTPPIPESCQWATFLRNHDELTLEMVTEDERQFMWDHYAPDPRMRLNLGIRRRLATLMDNSQARIELAYSLLFTLPGAPVLYYGDEIGMGDNIWLEDRDGVRTPMQWDASTNAGFSIASPTMLYAPVVEGPMFGKQAVNVDLQRADQSSLLHAIRRMISVRKRKAVLADGDLRWVDAGSASVAAFLRDDGNTRLLCVHNLSADPQHVTLSHQDIVSEAPRDLLSGATLAEVQGRLLMCIEASGYSWLEL